MQGSDVLILKALAQARNYRSLRSAVPVGALSGPAQALLAWYPVYFKRFEQHECIDWDAFLSMIVLESSAGKEQEAVLKRMVQQVRGAMDDVSSAGVLESLMTRALVGKAGAVLEAYNAGEEVDAVEELHSLARETRTRLAQTVDVVFIDDPIDELLEREGEDTGIKLPTRVLQEHVKGLQGGATIALGARPDAGKCLHPATPVLLADGRTVRADAVQVGDVLAGPYRNNTVLGTTTGTAQMYRVSYPWGESYTVNDAHILSLKRSKAEGPHEYGDVLNVNVEEYMQWPAGRKARYKGWKSGAEFPERQVPMNPYLLGLWLGDGSTGTSSYTTMDTELLQAFVDVYGEPTRTYNATTGKATTYSFGYSGLFDDLDAAGVLHHKLIPDKYLRNSRAVRAELLAGLVDSDGYVSNGIELVSKYRHLAEGVVWLARSLGCHATYTETFKRATNSDHAGATYYAVQIGSEVFDVIKLRRQRHLDNIPNRPRKRKGLQFGITVEPVGVSEYAGFSLDGDHLFLLGDFTVTHNTSFLSAVAVHAAKQIPEVFGEKRPILWFNNEGDGRRIVPRLYQAALNYTFPELVQASNEGRLVDEYAAAVGDVHAIRVMDMHSASLAQLEQVIERVRPAVVVYDMLANFSYDGERSGGNKTDGIEQRWQQVRTMAVEYDHIGIGTIQVSADGDDQLFPPMSALKDSKTGVQGATDVIILLGKLNDPQMNGLRGISTPKNKFQMPNRPGHVQEEIAFVPERCQFPEIGEVR